MQPIKLLFCLYLLLGWANMSHALSPIQPAAIVNDTVITVYDLQQRIDLTLLQSQSERNKSNRLTIAPTVMANLINEQLHIKEATRLNEIPNQRELDQAIAQFEVERSIEAGGIAQLLAEAKIDYQSFVDSFKAQIAWQNVIQNHLEPQIEITEAEIEREMERKRQILTKNNAEETRIMLILLPNEGKDSASLIANATKLKASINAGASFSELARQVSVDLSAQYGGDLGWIPTTELPQRLQDWLISAQNDSISDPILLPEGVALFQLKGKRQANEGNINAENAHLRLGNIKLQSKIRALERNLQREAIIERKLQL